MFKNHLKIAVRNLLSNRIFTLVNILGLTIGMSTAMLIFIWVQNEWSFDKHHQDADRIYRIISHIEVGNDEIWDWESMPYPAIEHIEGLPEVEQLTVLSGKSQRSKLAKIGDSDIQELEDLALVDSTWFELFQHDVLQGSLSTFFKNLYSVALTEELARKHFGSTDVIGKTLEIDSTNYTVNVLLANPPTNTNFQYKAYIPIQTTWQSEKWKNERSKHWGNFDYMLFLKLVEGVADVAPIETKIRDLFKQNREKNNVAFTLEPLEEVRLSPLITGGEFQQMNRAGLYIFALIGFILLLTAGLNYINLSTALASKRMKEIGVKKIIGASFKHVFTQILSETFIISFLAFGLSVGAVAYFLPILSNYIEIPLALDWQRSQIWIGLLGLLLLSVLLSGVYPALLFGGFQPINLLREKKGTSKGISLRKGLIVTQFSLAIITLIGTIVIYEQLQHIQHMNVGYSRTQIIDFQPNLFATKNWRDNVANFKMFEEVLRKMPEFEQVAGISNSIIEVNSSNGGNFEWEGKDPDFEALVNTFSADERLVELFGLEMVEGRWFSEDYSTDKKGIILNETAVKALGIPEPIVGRKAKFREEGEIIGIVKDFHIHSPRDEIKPLLINYANGWVGHVMAKVHPKNTTTAITKAKKAFHSILPTLPFEYSFLDESYQKMHQVEAKLSTLFQVFTGLLLFIACLGLFGLSTFAVERRTKEIGIRKVLGANARIIVQLLSKDFLKLIALALLFASPVAWYLAQRWLENYAYGIEVQWWMFALAGVSVIIIAFFTVSVQSIKAALANPIESLRNE